MSPILGIIASQNYPRVTNSYESIATTTLGSTTATISFTSIPSTYKHLQVRFILRSNRAAVVADSLNMQFNSDTGSNYVDHYLTGDGATASAGADTSVSNIAMYRIAGDGAGASTFGVGVIDILDYQNTSKYKTSRSLVGIDNNGAGRVSLNSGLWMSTSAISTVTLFPNSGSSSFVQYSSAALYGIKG